MSTNNGFHLLEQPQAALVSQHLQSWVTIPNLQEVRVSGWLSAFSDLPSSTHCLAENLAFSSLIVDSFFPLPVTTIFLWWITRLDLLRSWGYFGNGSCGSYHPLTWDFDLTLGFGIFLRGIFSTCNESWPLAITLNFSALQTFETFYILGQGLVTVHQDYYIASRLLHCTSNDK